MNRIFIRTLVVCLLAVPALAQNIRNAKVSQLAVRGSVGDAAAQATRGGAQWVAWSVPVSGISICCWQGKGYGNNRCCGECSLDGRNQNFSMGDDRQHETTEMLLVARLGSGGRIERIKLFDHGCGVSANGETIAYLTGVTPQQSLDYLASAARTATKEGEVVTAIAQHDAAGAVPLLERLAGRGYEEDVRESAIFWIGQRGGERGFRYLRDFLRSDEPTDLRKKAVFSMSQSKAAESTQELINLARHDKSREIRRDAIFWLGQKAGDKAADELRRFVDEDEDEDVREHAVFAISQLPRERSVPILIDLVKNHKSAGVRKKAMFWLAQTGDARAIDLIEEILNKR